MRDPWPERTIEEADIFAKALSPLPRGAVFYDLGCGEGHVTEALLRTNPGARAVIVDRQPVLDRTTARLSQVAPRFAAVPADLLSVQHSGNAALVILANVLHSYAHADSQQIVNNAAALLAPRGRLAVRDLARQRGRVGLDFALHMALLSTTGDAHPEPRVQAWMEQANLTVKALPGYPTHNGCFALIGTKPHPAGPRGPEPRTR